MTNTSHTPRPWLVTNAHIENGEWVTGISSEKEDGTIALVIGSKARSGFSDESLVSEANASLIAAAPDLLEALKEALLIVETQMGKDAVSSPIWHKGMAAIAKAKGE